MIKTLQTRWYGLWGNLEDLVDTGTGWARSVLPWEGWQKGRVKYEEGFGANAQTSSSRSSDMRTDSTTKELDVMETGTVTAWDAVDILWEMGALIVLSGGAKSRRSGLRKAADYIEEHHERWGDITAEELQELEWAEEATETLLQLQQQDVPTLLGELRSELGKNAADLLRVRGIGLDKATTIHEELDVWTLEELEDAARNGVLLQVKGIGPKSLEKLKGNIKAALEEKKARLQRRAAAKKQVAVKTETTPQARSVEKPVEAASSTTHPSSNEPRDLLDLLRCPTTHQSGFEMSGSEAVLPATGRRYTVTQGVLDMVGEGHAPPSWAQTVMENRLYTRFYESVFRPNLTRIVTRRSVKDDIALSLEMLELQPEWSVLDVACGPGNYTRAIAQALEPEKGVAVGVDVSWPMLRKAVIHKARKRISNLHFVRGSALHLPFQNDSFDAVHCTAALHLFSDPSRALHEFHRVIRPNGHLVIGTFLQSRFLPLRLAQRIGSPLTGFHWFSLEELEDVVMDAGFTVARTEINGLAISLSAVAHND
ncbi:MAG: methyltransferase domain-containing protein [Deltaproteobacteria bacterium]|nr:MAG: methyltransferase domain-containing protein [Deltaproteobacteria bacterium]